MLTLQVVGYKNTGKTTLVCKLIQFFSAKGYNVASLKHHGHGGGLHGSEITDSWKHREAGAVIAGVEGGGDFHMMIHQPSWNLNTLLEFYKIIDVDILLIEGFKRENFLKILLIGDETDLPLIKELTNIKAIVTSLPMVQEEVPCPVFKPTETDRLCEWLDYTLFGLED